mmetsp:Transcript_38795/g.81405  ORF Transcript_38795/g.81405 Transcript_38795/m.81405 type:complete len:81 (-) Transcript_38795:10374-10616(-)
MQLYICQPSDLLHICMPQPNLSPIYNNPSELMSTAQSESNAGLEKSDFPPDVFACATNGAAVPPAPLTRTSEAEGRASKI